MMWQPIETAPRSPLGGEHIVLVGWTNSTNICRAFWDTASELASWVALLPEGNHRLRGRAVRLSDPPTHWMPLPEPPCDTTPIPIDASEMPMQDKAKHP